MAADSCFCFRYGTETMSSFRNKSGHSSHQPGLTSSKAAFETYKSSVFRNGDWNVAEPCISRHSVTRSDFHIKPFSTLAEEPSGKTELEEEKVNSLNETEELPVDPKGISLLYVVCIFTVKVRKRWKLC